jgi:hydroxymethylglutaryl-CoA synthase
MKKNDSVGIVGYGAYVPCYRIKIDQIAASWNKSESSIKKSLLIDEKSVAGKDEDSVTMAVEATKNAIEQSGIQKSSIGALYVGSESHPYAVKPTSVIVGQCLGLSNFYMAADLEFACKAGTAALQVCYGLLKSNQVEYAIAVGSDVAQALPGDVLEYAASAGSSAFILGNRKGELIATIDAMISYTSDTPDFWRRSYQRYPRHANRFTGEPSYFKHMVIATKKLLEKERLRPSDFDYAIFHQPNGKFPLVAAKKLGFLMAQIEPGLLVQKIGNPYSASSLLALAAVLDNAEPNQKILVTSYGSGSGSDSFILTTTKLLEKKKDFVKNVIWYINRKKYIDYTTYRRHMESR